MSDALFLEMADLAVPTTTDWSSLSLLLAGGNETEINNKGKFYFLFQKKKKKNLQFILRQKE